MKIILRVIKTSLLLLVFGSCQQANDTDTADSHGLNPETLQNAIGVHAAFYNGVGNRISVSTTTGELLLTDTTLTVIHSAKAHEGGATSGFFSLDDSMVVTGGSDSLVKVWDANTLNEVERFSVPFAPYTTVYGYNSIASCGSGGNVWMYWKKEDVVRHMTLDSLGAYFLYYLVPDTFLLISSGKQALIANMSYGGEVASFDDQTGLCFCVMPDSEGKRIVTASSDSIVRVYTPYGIVQYESEQLDGPCYVGCFNPTEDMVATSTTSGTIYFLDTTLAEVKMVIDAFDTQINTIHYSPDGKRMVAGSEGGGAKIFDTRTGELLYSLEY